MGENDDAKKGGWGRRVLQFPLVHIVLAAAPIVGVIILAQAVLPRGADAEPVQIALGGVALLVYVGFVRLVERRRPAELGARGAAAEAGLGFLLGAAMFGLTMAILFALGLAHVGRGDGVGAMVVGLVAAVSTALLEETLLRAIFFRIVEASLGSWIALALSAALFGLLHAGNPGATAASTVAIALEAGVILGAAFMFTRRLWMAIGLHAAWNFSEGGLFGASVSGNRAAGLASSHFTGPALLSGGTFGPEASIVAVVVCLAGGVALAVGARRRGHVVRPFWRR